MSSNYLTVQEKVKLLEDNLKKADVLLDKRFLFFAFNCLGKNTEVQLQNGNRAQGSFFTSNFENGGVVLKNYKEVNAAKSTAQKVLSSKDFVYLLVPEVEEPPVIKPKQNIEEVFKTDTEISRNKFAGQRNLVKWNQEEFSGETLEEGLDEMPVANRNWNQFEINEKKFGITSEWEEGKYTVEVDFNKVDPRLMEKAKKIEAEILAGTSEYESRHIREERGLIGQAEDVEDEEELYSSVIRTEQKGPEKPNLPKFVNMKKNPSKPDEKSVSEPKGEVRNEWLKPKETSHKGNFLDIPQQNPKRDGKADGKTNLQALDLPAPKKIPDDAQQKFNEFKRREEQQEAARMRGNQDPSKNEGTEVPKIDLRFDESPPNKNKLSLRASSFEVGGNELNSINMSRTSLSTQSTTEFETKKTIQPTTPQPQMVNLHPTLTTKFKIKLTERDLKKSETSFQDYVIANWEKKNHFHDPEKFNSNWKIQKQAVSSQTSLSQTTTPKSSTSTATSLQSTSTAFTSANSDQTRSKAKSFPNQSPQHQTQHQGQQHHHHQNQMQQPSHNQGYLPQPMMMNPYVMPYTMQFVPMQMGTNYYQYPKNPQYIDTLHPNFNMSMNYSPNPNPNQRQGSGKFYKKGSSSNQGQNQNQQNQNQNQNQNQ